MLGPHPFTGKDFFSGSSLTSPCAFSSDLTVSCHCSSPGAGRAARGGGGGYTGNTGSISTSPLSPGGHGPVQQQAEAPAQPAQFGDRCPHIGDLTHLGNGLAWYSPPELPVLQGQLQAVPPAYGLWMGPELPVSSVAN